MKIIKLMSFLYFVIFVQMSFSQSNNMERTMNKVEKLLDKNEVDEAEKILEAMLFETPSYGKGWDLLVNIKKFKVNQAAKNGFSLGKGIQITTEDENGIKLENDSLTNSLMEMLSGNFLEKIAKEEFINTLRKATLLSNNAYRSSIYLRTENIDEPVDTNVNQKSLSFFKLAEEEFQNKNYGKAAKMYNKALKNQPDFYKAILYLGDAFYMQGNQADALEYYKKAHNMYPNKLEPVKYLSDAYMAAGLYEKSLEMCIKSFLIYPDLAMKAKLEFALYKMEKELNIKGVLREIFPNSANSANNHIVNIGDKQIIPSESWSYYSDALEKIATYINKDGTLQNNEITKHKFLELYSWEQILKNTNDDSFQRQNK